MKAIMKDFVWLLIVILAVFAAVGSYSYLWGGGWGDDSKTKIDSYNPDTLPPGEVACGNPHSKRSAPCECMKARLKIQDEQMARCGQLLERKTRMECLRTTVERCPVVLDEDGARREGMAAQCKRSCTRARCECCKT